MDFEHFFIHREASAKNYLDIYRTKVQKMVTKNSMKGAK